MSLKVVTTFIGQVEYPTQYFRLPDIESPELPGPLKRWSGLKGESYFHAEMKLLGFYWVRCHAS